MDWLDAARYADTNGYQNDFARTMWPWRDWVIAAFNRNQPFDQFIIEQIAGDLLPDSTRSTRRSPPASTATTDRHRGRLDRRGVADRVRRRPRRDHRDRLARPDDGLRPLPRPQVRPDHAEGVLPVPRLLQQRRREGRLHRDSAATSRRWSPSQPEERAQSSQRLDAAVAGGQWRATQPRRRSPTASSGGRKTGSGPSRRSRDWTVRPARRRPRLQGSSGETDDGLAGKRPAHVGRRPRGQAIWLDGQAESYVEVEQGVEPRPDRSFFLRRLGQAGGRRRLREQDGRRGRYRGFDLLIDDGKVAVHMVHAWPGDALKVTTKEPLPRTHGPTSSSLTTAPARPPAEDLPRRPARELEVQADKLKGSIVNEQPLRIGKRSTAPGFKANSPTCGSIVEPSRPTRSANWPSAQMLALARTPPSSRSRRRRSARRAITSEHVDRRRRAEADADEAPQGEDGAAKQHPDRHGDGGPPQAAADLRPEARAVRPARHEPKVDPGVPACLGALPPGAPANRLGLARWLVSPDNPLTARVTVNRLWQHHFGVGTGQDGREFRPSGRAAVAPGAARLAGDRVRPHRLGCRRGSIG